MNGPLTLRLCILLASVAFAYVGCDLAEAAPVRTDQLISDSLQLDVDARHGGELYRALCASCHGASGQGDASRLIPALAGQRKAYLIMQLANFSEHDRTSPQMQSVIDKVEMRDPQAWANLASFISAQPLMVTGETGDGTGIKLGEASYRQWCTSCHEDDARGDPDGFIPSLRNQHYAYLVSSMRGIAKGHRANADQDLVRFLSSLDSTETSAIADYLSRQRGPVRDRARLLDDGSIRE